MNTNWDVFLTSVGVTPTKSVSASRHGVVDLWKYYFDDQLTPPRGFHCTVTIRDIFPHQVESWSGAMYLCETPQEAASITRRELGLKRYESHP